MSAPQKTWPVETEGRTLAFMRQRCEVCENFRPENASRPGQKLVSVPLDVRNVVLCTGHARIAKNSGAETFEALRELYGSGRRSYVPRRSPRSKRSRDDKRVGRGRRESDRARAR
jgi:hypothetical protein